MGFNGILKEKLDVTLERPDVTLYGLIELLFVQFCLAFSGLCVRMFAVVFAFIFEDRVLSSISLSTYITCYSPSLPPPHICINPLLFLLRPLSSSSAESIVLPGPSFMLQSGQKQ